LPTGSAGKKSIIEAYGAIAIDFNRMSVAEYVKEYTSEEGFDVIFDTIGGDTLDASFKALKIYEGHLVSILGWGTHSLAPLSFRGATYSGVFTLLPLITGKNRSHHGEILKEAARLAEAGKLKPLLDTISYNMETITDAYHAMEQKTNQGKVVISI